MTETTWPKGRGPLYIVLLPPLDDPIPAGYTESDLPLKGEGRQVLGTADDEADPCQAHGRISINEKIAKGTFGNTQSGLFSQLTDRFILRLLSSRLFPPPPIDTPINTLAPNS